MMAHLTFPKSPKEIKTYPETVVVMGDAFLPHNFSFVRHPSTTDSGSLAFDVRRSLSLTTLKNILKR